MDPFATFGIERCYDVDLRAVEKTHRELSRVLHPDRYLATAIGERREALARAVEVNEAWRILRDPLRRAEALMALCGLSTDHRERSPEPEFLMEMLEQREALSEARGARDRKAVSDLAGGIRARWTETERELSNGLTSGGHETVVDSLGKLRFYRRFLDEVSAIEDELVS
jgi:molecular chaperone HscB